MSVTRVEGDPEEQVPREKVHRLVILALVGALVATWVSVVWLVEGKSSVEDDLAEAEDDLASYAAGPDAQAAAESILGEMISFDHRDLDDEYEWTSYLADSELRADYEDDIVPRLSKVIRRTKASADGEIDQSAYNIVDEETVNVLAFIRQRLTDVDNRDGLIAEQWASLTMVRDDGDWLVGKIDIVSVPPPS